jgi:hypothetical protein
MLVHMLLLQPDYRTKFGAFMGTLANGEETGSAMEKVYGQPVSRVNSDLVFYANRTGIMVVTVPFKYEKPTPPQTRTATKEETDKTLSDLTRPL